MYQNRMKALLREGRPQIGACLPWPSPDLAEALAYLGFDVLMVDGEHGLMTAQTALAQVRAIEAGGASAIVRVIRSPHGIQEAVEIGAAGVQVAHVNNKEQASEVVRSAKFYPQGERGANFSVRAALHGAASVSEYVRRANDETLVLVQIETLEAIENLDDILTVEGVDVFVVGSTDLSFAVGRPGEYASPEVKQVVDRALDRIIAAKRHAGILAPTIEYARSCICRGAMYVLVPAVSSMLRSAGTWISELSK